MLIGFVSKYPKALLKGNLSRTDLTVQPAQAWSSDRCLYLNVGWLPSPVQLYVEG